MTIIDRAKRALWKKSGFKDHPKGYLANPEMNLLPGVTPKMIKDDYLKGSGHEWKSKFRAIHSSAALAANTFGRWKTEPALLTLGGHTGFDKLEFEAQCPTGLGGTPPNLDVLLKSTNTVIGIESKLLEPLTPTTPKFSASYSKDRLPLCDDIWWNLLEQVRQSPATHLDAAQLIKHYLGLRKKSSDYKNVLLVYLFWKPLNADKIDVYARHAEALETFRRAVQHSKTMRFISLDYLQLWDAWEKDRNMAEHARLLKDRYCVEI
jgi:hypothetical protein